MVYKNIRICLAAYNCNAMHSILYKVFKLRLDVYKRQVVILSLITVILFSLMRIENKKARKGGKGKISYSFLKYPHFWISTGILFFYLCAETAINGWLVTYFKDTGIMNTNTAQALSSILWRCV